jgi:hypothetical protein
MALPDVARDSTAQAERAARDAPKPTEALSIDDDALARELEAELAIGTGDEKPECFERMRRINHGEHGELRVG